MITVAMVVHMLLCGPAAFTLTEEPLVLDASGICQVERDHVCLTADEEREAYDWMADHD